MNHQHLTAHIAWRVSFIVPFIIITAIALAILFTGEDTPTGKWADRHHAGEPLNAPTSLVHSVEKTVEPTEELENLETETTQHLSAVEIAKYEVIVAPTLNEATSVFFSIQTLALAAPYACSFGKLAPPSIYGWANYFRW